MIVRDHGVPGKGYEISTFRKAKNLFDHIFSANYHLTYNLFACREVKA